MHLDLFNKSSQCILFMCHCRNNISNQNLHFGLFIQLHLLIVALKVNIKSLKLCYILYNLDFSPPKPFHFISYNFSQLMQTLIYYSFFVVLRVKQFHIQSTLDMVECWLSSPSFCDIREFAECAGCRTIRFYRVYIYAYTRCYIGYRGEKKALLYACKYHTRYYNMHTVRVCILMAMSRVHL